jgi:hypothetical protein
MYINRVVDGSIETINPRRPYTSYNVPISRRDPGPDGVLNNSDDGGRITLYDYSTAVRGAAFDFSKRVNADNTDRFNSVEFTVTKRASNRWMGQISYFAVKNHRWLAGNFRHPNDEFFPLDNQWRWNVKLNGNYNLPHDFLVGGIVELVNGAFGQRTYVFRAIDPSGPPLRQLATVTIPLEPYGSRREPHQTTFNARVAKKVVFSGKSLNFSFDVLNVTNSNAITAVTYVSGPSFGRVNDILPPRSLRAGVTFDF